MPSINLNDVTRKVLYIYGVPMTTSLKFSYVSLYGRPFSRYCIFYEFPIDSHLKNSKCHKIFKTWLIAKKSNSLYSTMAANVLIKFG